jgi:hypothetical protein
VVVLRVPGLERKCASGHRTARSHRMLDLFYLVIGAAGCWLLWAITKAFDRV